MNLDICKKCKKFETINFFHKSPDLNYFIAPACYNTNGNRYVIFSELFNEQNKLFEYYCDKYNIRSYKLTININKMNINKHEIIKISAKDKTQMKKIIVNKLSLYEVLDVCPYYMEHQLYNWNKLSKD